MAETKENTSRRPIRWWPAWLVLAAMVLAIGIVQCNESMPFQRRNLTSYPIGAGGMLLLLIWWAFFSRATLKLRVGLPLAFIAAVAGWFGLFRVVGVTGDLVPVFGLRWKSASTSPEAVVPESGKTSVAAAVGEVVGSYPQFLGPDRNGRLSGPLLSTNWEEMPPRVLWRKPAGAGWAGFAIVGSASVTMEQVAENEQVACYDAGTGELRWKYSYPAHYNTPIGGEGPRTTPTILSNRVYTMGATGWLNCLDLKTGSNYWKVDVMAAAGARILEWGVSCSPLVANGLVIVSPGGPDGHSVMAFDAQNGRVMWSAGNSQTSYGSPSLVELAGRAQILIQNSRSLASHDPKTGAVLWEKPWGIGYPLIAMPIVVATNRVLFAAGYNVGAELFEITRDGDAVIPKSVWRSVRLKPKFSNPVLKAGYVYGLDDGMLACIDVRDGALRWKGERYGHGQCLLVADRLLLMTERGELVLMIPTPDGPGKTQSFTVFAGKTWNPISLSGNRVYARTDKELACIELPVATVR